MNFHQSKPVSRNAFFYTYGQDVIPSYDSAVTDPAGSLGWRFTGMNSIERMQELRNAKIYGRATPAERATHDQEAFFDPRVGRKPMARPDLPWTTEQYEERYPTFSKTRKLQMLTPEHANEEYGLDGELSWSEPVSSLEAYILQQRKLQELRLHYQLDRAYGMEAVKGFGIEMGMALMDPVMLPFIFVPPLGATALLGKLGWVGSQVGSRAVRGGLGGFYGTGLAEIPIYAAATQEQADYGALNSLLNVTFGALAGAGLHIAGGFAADLFRAARGVSKYRTAKRHMAAMDTAVKQTVSGQTVEVTPVLELGKPTVGEAAKGDPVIPDLGDASKIPAPPEISRTTPQTPNDGSVVMKADTVGTSRSASKGTVQRVATQLDTLTETQPEFAAALDDAVNKGFRQKMIWRLRLDDGRFVMDRTDNVLSPFETGVVGESLDLTRTLDATINEHGVDMADVTLRYDRTELVNGEAWHIMDLDNVKFDPAHMTRDTAFIRPDDVLAQFQGSQKQRMFTSELERAQESQVNELIQDAASEGPSVTRPRPPENYDEHLDATSLAPTKHGENLGSHPGKTVIDNNTGQVYYAKYYEKKGPGFSSNEVFAALLYRLLGVNSPKTRLILGRTPKGKVEVRGVAAEWRNDLSSLSIEEYLKLPPATKRAFFPTLMHDIFLGNWDAAKNLAITKDGEIVRLDPGGALMYRAGGEMKPPANRQPVAYEAHPKDEDSPIKRIPEFDTFIEVMKNGKKRNPTMYAIFEDMGKILADEGYKIKPTARGAMEFLKTLTEPKRKIFELDPKEIQEMLEHFGGSTKAMKVWKAEVTAFLSGRREFLGRQPENQQLFNETHTKNHHLTATNHTQAKEIAQAHSDVQAKQLSKDDLDLIDDWSGAGYVWVNTMIRLFEGGELSPADLRRISIGDLDFYNMLPKLTKGKKYSLESPELRPMLQHIFQHRLNPRLPQENRLADSEVAEILNMLEPRLSKSGKRIAPKPHAIEAFHNIFKAAFHSYRDEFHRIFDKVPGLKTGVAGLQVWRGGTPVPNVRANGLVLSSTLDTPATFKTASAMDGGEFILDGASSSSLSEGTGKSFNKEQTDVLLQINVPNESKVLVAGVSKQKDMSGWAQGAEEAEVLFPPGSLFKITGVLRYREWGKNRVGFYVDYIPPWMKNTNAELKTTTLTTADSLAIREQYNKGPSNGVSDTPKASEATDPDLRIDDDERQATLKPDQQKAAEHQQKLIEDDFNDRKNEIFDEVATLDVRDEHTQAILDEVTAMADEAVADVKQAKVFHDAAKIAASCLKGLPHE